VPSRALPDIALNASNYIWPSSDIHIKQTTVDLLPPVKAVNVRCAIRIGCGCCIASREFITSRFSQISLLNRQCVVIGDQRLRDSHEIAALVDWLQGTLGIQQHLHLFPRCCYFTNAPVTTDAALCWTPAAADDEDTAPCKDSSQRHGNWWRR